MTRRARRVGIVAGIALATLPDSKVPWSELVADYDLIRGAFEAVIPGFDHYNVLIREPGGFRLPLPPKERVWKTPSGRAEFLVFDGLVEDAAAGDPSVLTLTTVRSHDQYNTTIYGFDDRYRGVFGRRDVVFMNEDDLASRGIAHGDAIVVETAFGGVGESAYCVT